MLTPLLADAGAFFQQMLICFAVDQQ